MSDMEDISDYERLRHKNLKELEEFVMCSFDNSGLDDESLETLQYFSKKEHEIVTKPTRKRKRESDDDKTFRFTGQLPLYSRRSARLSNLPPEYTYTELDDEDLSLRDSLMYKKHNRNISNLENVISKPRKSYSSRHVDAVFVPANEITDDYIANIAERSTIKIYSPSGTCCHQCRQKTLDSKTYCRSGRCVGVRGQFCGVCLKNRYGEDAAVVLKDPSWACPPCRGLCNCSICRAKEGKCPTGILAPIAFRHGHKSVKDFLMSLNGEGDYIHKAPSKATEHKQNQSGIEGDLLGFDADLNPVWIARGSSDEGDLLGFSVDGGAVLTKKYLYY